MHYLAKGCFVYLMASSIAAAQSKDEQSLAKLSRELDAGLYSFVSRVKVERLPSPQIHSAWYVSELPKQQVGKSDWERQKRQFGRRLVETLEQTSKDVLELKDAAGRERAAAMLLDLSEWIAQTPGYGNMLLFNRCQDMATVPLAHLIADLSYPEAKLDAFMARLRTWEDMVGMSADALNSELPVPIFVAGKGSDSAEMQRPVEVSTWHNLDEVRRPIKMTWQTGASQVYTWVKENLPQYTMSRGEKVRQALPANLRFYCDDELFGPEAGTTLRRWEVKFHTGFVAGLGGWNPNHIRYLLLFRKKVGKFPAEPPAWWKPGDRSLDTPVKAAFEQAWQPFRMQFGPIYAAAALVYEEVASNTFYDQDTRDNRLQQALTSHPTTGSAPGPWRNRR